MSDLAPMTEVKLTEFYHIKLCLEYVGAVTVLEKLEEEQKLFPKLPGMGLAVATAKAETADIRTRMLTNNLKVAFKHGFDAEVQTMTMSVRKDGIYLQATTEPE